MREYFDRKTSATPLAVFRVIFGTLVLAGIIRFWMKGWIDELYIQPKIFFPFYGFEFVSPLGNLTYVLFFVCGMSAFLFAIGCFYRISSIVLFLSFTYIEFIDKSTYLNHYYFISMVCMLMTVLPAHVQFSVDARRNRDLMSKEIPAWCIDCLKLFICVIYFYAGVAKINSDWLLEAQPLKIWLPANNDLPIIGSLLNYEWVAYAFSWAGCLYDLSIPFLLWRASTRSYAFVAIVVFHVMTAILFPIGMFPYIMIASSTIFFSSRFHERIITRLRELFKVRQAAEPRKPYSMPVALRRVIPGFVALFFVVQLTLPFRYLFYPDELFWTEQGYRFSWRVMLMEKSGYAEFIIRDQSGKKAIVSNSDFLTPLQEKMMATQPDMIIQYAHFLRDHYAERGFYDPSVYVDSYVSLNGRIGRPLVNPNVDLAELKDSFHPKNWLLPFENEISGF